MKTMASSCVQVKPIGLPHGFQRVMLEKLSNSSPDFPRNRSGVSCNLFGSPKTGEINEIFQRDQNKRLNEFFRKYDVGINTISQNNSAVDCIITAPNIESESRLGESLIDKECREHEMKLNQQRSKKTGSGRSRTLKQNKSEETTANRTYVDIGPKCNGSGERPKPYARQQQSITDYYGQRKTVVCNNSRTPDVQSVEQTTELPLQHSVQEHTEIEENTTAISASEPSSQSISSSSSLSTLKSQEQISLHTMTTDHSAKLD